MQCCGPPGPEFDTCGLHSSLHLTKNMIKKTTICSLHAMYTFNKCVCQSFISYVTSTTIHLYNKMNKLILIKIKGF